MARSPKAAGCAKTIGRSGETTPGTRNAKPTNRKLCKRSMGRRASVRGLLRSAGQTYCRTTIPHAAKLQGDTDCEQGLRRHHRSFPEAHADHSDHRVGLARWHFGCLSTSAPIHHPATWGSSEVGVPKTKTGAAPHRSGVDVHSLAPSPCHPERSEGSALGLFRVLHSRSFVAALLRMTGKDLHRRPADAISERRRSPRRFLCGVLPRHGRPRGTL